MIICSDRENFFKDINDFTILKICRDKRFIAYEVQFVYASSLYVLHITPGELKGVLEKVNYLTEVEENTKWYNLQTDKFCPDDFYLDNGRANLNWLFVLEMMIS